MTAARDSLVRVTSAAESATLDAAAIAAGTPSRELMRRAGVAAAKRIAHHLGTLGRSGVAIYAGSGNNGGDAWVVARELAKRGFTVRVAAAGIPSGADAVGARDEARRDVRGDEPRGDEAVIVDGLLGTGSRGAPRGGQAMTEFSSTGDMMLSVLECVAAHGPVPAMQCARICVINCTVAHRLLTTLARRLYVVKITGGYVLGPAAMSIAAPSASIETCRLASVT